MSLSLASFYRGKRVLVTGHTGFIGGWLVAWLKLLDAKVCGYGLPPSSRPNFFDATLLDRGISSLFADIRDRETLANTFADLQPEIIFHAAVQSHANDPQNDPIDLFETNILGMLNLLEEARLTACTRAVVIVSDSEHPERSAIKDWLGSMRTIARESALAFAGAFFPGTSPAIAIPRFPALIGGGDWSESRLCGRLIHALTSGEPITIRDTPFSCLHVIEAVNACFHLAQQLFISGSSVLGSCDFLGHHQQTSEVEIARQFASLSPDEDLQVEIQASEAVASVAPAPMPQLPGGHLALSLDQAVAWTVDWYKAYFLDSAPAWRTTDNQIEHYGKISQGRAISASIPAPS